MESDAPSLLMMALAEVGEVGRSEMTQRGGAYVLYNLFSSVRQGLELVVDRPNPSKSFQTDMVLRPPVVTSKEMLAPKAGIVWKVVPQD
jgi:hypothetical protein